MEFKFGGLSVRALEDVSEDMRILYDNGDEILMITKKTYEHREEEMNFDYKYLIHAIDMYEATGDSMYDEEEPFHIHVSMVVAPNSLHPNAVESIKDSSDGYCDYLDIYEYGFSVTMLEDDKLYPAKGIEELMYNVAYFIPIIDSMRGFHLDKSWNRMGSTGWDTLKECVSNESVITKALNRFKEVQYG